MEIDESWMPTLLCIVNDSIKYNDSLRNSQTVKDVEDIEEWMMSIYQFKGYLSEKIRQNKELLSKCEEYFED
ncbi:MAG: hypothetical protein OEZ68_06020 [Gammaproteobacteria bacterium]|nr:hypothetical protein [Gammaproteobacteria bacterium]